MSGTEQYDVNFFKPLSDHAKANKRLIIILATVWAVGVFGFQILLILLNQPTPEKSYEIFQSVYPAVVEDTAATPQMKIKFAKSLLHVLGKNIVVKDDHKSALKNCLTWTVANMQPDSVKPKFFSEPDETTYDLTVKTLDLQSSGFDKIMIDLLPTSLVKLNSEAFPEEYKSALPGIMKLYLVHNQNFFTDFIFLGFPFHYWYTAQFLLIMFVVLCIIYAASIEKANKKFNFVEET
ncbi:MAG: DUF4212 domain-containing protein [Ignavibacteria bacterium]|jgi:putative solute:sodium symporter small subunit